MKTSASLAWCRALLCGSIALSVGCQAPAPLAGGGVATVTFVEPERFTDVQRTGELSADSRKVLLPEIQAHIEAEAGKSLPPGSRLEVRFQDIDLAGLMRMVGGRLTRVSFDTSPARLEFEFTWKNAEGVMLKQGREALTSFGGPGLSRRSSGETLDVEKRLLSDWIRGLRN